MIPGGSAAKLLLTVEEAARELSIGRSLMYEHVLRGDVPSIKLGRCRRIRRTDLESFVVSLAGGQSSERSEEDLNSP